MLDEYADHLPLSAYTIELNMAPVLSLALSAMS